ncbi:hypothetical protein GTA08_BOTSDO13424 [Neofusicoccum parvum]|nr:hypothetical protein GTA08_BOTSDO13424 [Neofusicoccum parvum]
MEILQSFLRLAPYLTLPNITLAAVTLAAVTLTLALILKSILAAAFSPLRSIPGPFLARFTRLWLLRHFLRGDFHKTNIQLHQRYGPIVRIAPHTYSLSDPAALRPVYGHGSRFTKAAFYDASRNPDAPRADLFCARDPAAHAALRRLVARLYSASTVVRMEAGVHGCVGALVARLGEFARGEAVAGTRGVRGRGVEVDLQFWLQCYAFDVVGAVTVDRRFGFLERGEDGLGLWEALHRSLAYLTYVGVVPEWHRWAYAVKKWTGNNGMAGLFGFAAGEVGKRLQETAMEAAGEEKGGKEVEESGEDFLAKMVRMHREDPEKFGFSEMMLVCAMNIGAGSDSTSVALSAVMWFLMKHPEVLAKLRAELDTAAAEGLISATEFLSYQQAQKLPYLQAVISEGLRVHSPPGVPLSREAPKGGAEIAGTFFPEGSVLGMNAWVMHANKDVFGDDAEEYRPERWLVSKEEIGRMDRSILTWGLGSRTCIGKNIALMEISILIPELVRSFDFRLVRPDAELETQNVFFVKQKNLWVNVSERKTEAP